MRNFLQGVSLGILFTVSLVSYVLYSSPLSEESVAERELGVEQATEYLEAKGYSVEMGGVDGIPLKEKEVEEVVEPVKEETEPVEEVKKKANEFELTINEGMSSKDVSAVLFEKGIIKDEAEFEKFLGKNGYSRKIQLGSYYLNEKMSYEQIGKMIAN